MLAPFSLEHYRWMCREELRLHLQRADERERRWNGWGPDEQIYRPPRRQRHCDLWLDDDGSMEPIDPCSFP